ncbi:MAG TPA: hypothetical protein PK544_09365 [Spirochaetota bacterium]|nr:hypothetical protein [Spirochaetota bacterium]
MKSRYILLLFMLTIMLHCSNGPAQTGSAPEVQGNHWNNLARFLGGMTVQEDSNLKKAAATGAFRTHRQTMDRFWDQVKKRNISKISPWRDDHIPVSCRTNTVFYPLSGADFVNLYTFFPRAKSYIMASVEDQGPIPQPHTLTPGRLKTGLGSIRQCIASIASINYLLTRDQRIATRNTSLPGTMPVLLAVMARLELHITDVQQITIGADGRIRKHEGPSAPRPGHDEISGCRILFNNGNAPQQELVYLSMRLSSSSFDEGRAGRNFLASLGDLNTFTKSAIYLLQLPGFRNVCRFIMERSVLVLQDYSGIPYRYFSEAEWDIRLFGSYRGPVGFGNYPNPPRQPDLIRAYRTGRPPLPFHFGYGTIQGKGRSNLMLMIKKQRTP